MQLEISPEERDLLSEILSSFRSDLRAEIHRTDGPYKRELKEEETLLNGLLDKLQKLQQPAGVGQ
jgi:hypothetical protein